MKKLFAFIPPVFALEPPGSIGIIKSGASGPFNVLCVVASWLFTFAIIFSIILAIMTAIQYMTAGGNPERLSSAHRRLLFVAIGVAVAIIARSLPVLVGALLQTDSTALGGVC